MNKRKILGVLLSVVLLLVVIFVGDAHFVWLWAHRLRAVLTLALVVACVWYVWQAK